MQVIKCVYFTVSFSKVVMKMNIKHILFQKISREHVSEFQGDPKMAGLMERMRSPKLPKVPVSLTKYSNAVNKCVL